MNQTDRITLGLLSVILHRLNSLHIKVDRMSEKEQQLESDFAAIKADLDNISANVTATVQAQQTTIDAQKAQIADLQAQVAAGGAVTPEQLDALLATADALKGQADGILAALPGATPPATPATGA